MTPPYVTGLLSVYRVKILVAGPFERRHIPESHGRNLSFCVMLTYKRSCADLLFELRSLLIVPFVGSGLQKKYALTHALTRTVMNVGMQSIAAGNGSSMPFVPL